MWADAALAVIAGDKDESVRLAAAHILAKLTPNGLFPPEALEPIVQASLRRCSSPTSQHSHMPISLTTFPPQRLGDFSKSVRAAYRELLGAVGYSVILNHAVLAPAPEEINWKVPVPFLLASNCTILLFTWSTETPDVGKPRRSALPSASLPARDEPPRPAQSRAHERLALAHVLRLPNAEQARRGPPPRP